MTVLLSRRCRVCKTILSPAQESNTCIVCAASSTYVTAYVAPGKHAEAQHQYTLLRTLFTDKPVPVILFPSLYKVRRDA